MKKIVSTLTFVLLFAGIATAGHGFKLASDASAKAENAQASHMSNTSHRKMSAAEYDSYKKANGNGKNLQHRSQPTGRVCSANIMQANESNLEYRSQPTGRVCNVNRMVR